MSNSSSSSNSLGFFGLLQIVFIVLKLTGISSVAGWTWPWVFLPMFLGFVFYFGMIAALAIFYILTNRD